MQKYHKMFSTKQTPQSEPIPGMDMVQGRAGGYVFAVDDWQRLDRFLVLGSDSPTYYASAQELTIENAASVQRCIDVDGLRTVARIVEIGDGGRAPKNDPALFALAMCASLGNDITRKAALNALPKAARIGTHLFHFLEYCKAFRGWGRGLRTAVANWYNGKTVADLAYQVVKYRQRDGWTHRDALRLAHPVPPDRTKRGLYEWVTKGQVEDGWSPDELEPEWPELHYLWAFDRAQAVDQKDEILMLILKFNLPREAIPTEWLKHAEVWEALLEKMPMTAMIRNLATMTRVGLIAPMSDAAAKVVNELRDEHRILKARVHPIAVLSAMKTYQAGRGVRGKHTWSPVSQVVDALDDAFYLAFGNVEPIGKPVVLALDVSGSMSLGEIAGVPGLTPRMGAAAMAMVTARVESQYAVISFQDRIVPLEISPRERLDDVVRKTRNLPFGRTDCAQPMLWALQNNISANAFIIYTDNETWCGRIHPCQALQQYRNKMNVPAKLVTVGMTSNGFSISDPDDGGMLDVVGFNSAAPNVISDFIR